MRHLLSNPSRGLHQLPTISARTSCNSCALQHSFSRTFFTRSKKTQKRRRGPTSPIALLTGGFCVWLLYPSDDFAKLSKRSIQAEKSRNGLQLGADGSLEQGNGGKEEDTSAWAQFSRNFENYSLMTEIEWSEVSDKLVGLILPDWSKVIPGYLRKLQRELSMADGSLADEIWQEAHDPLINPEIRYTAEVRVSADLCDEEKKYLARRRLVARVALAKYLDLKEEDIHPADVPTIALCGSGGGLRALVAGTGSMLAAEEDGLFDCVTYTSGVSGSTWLQLLYLTSFNKGSFASLLDHLKARASTHIAYPPTALHAMITLPTSKYLLSGLVEKLKGDPTSEFGLVDLYGLLLSARFLVPRGELGVNERDFKISNQRDFIKYGQLPMPIYTTVRHEIPGLEEASSSSKGADEAKAEAKRESWFQWFEITPYEFFCEEFGAGVPTWALGRRFEAGKDVPPESGFHLPEIRTPLLMGVFGSAFCATLSHYYREIRPVIKGVTGLASVDEMINGRNEDLSKVHPIDPAKIPNFAYHMKGKLRKTTPESVFESPYLQLMDAGMSNNLPIYPLLRPGREVDVLVAFDASADQKTENWLSVADGYARQRGVKGWPLGIGWPKPVQSVQEARSDLEQAQAESAKEAEQKVQQAKDGQNAPPKGTGPRIQSSGDEQTDKSPNADPGDLGYCTVWVGTTQERSAEPPGPSKALTTSSTWKLMEPDAGIAVIYLPYLPNDAVPGLDANSTDFLSTWNFVYTPEQIDDTVKLAKANFGEGKEQIRATVRAVYERKKKLRLEGEKSLRREKLKIIARRGEDAVFGEGDQFS